MKLEFESIEEVKEFVTKLKGTRGKGGKDDADEAPATGQVPAPLQPPQGQTFSPTAFAPQAAAGAFPGPNAAPAMDPAIATLVNRITTRIDGAVASGQPADQVLAWFRGQCGPEAANATMEQIKNVFLPKAAMPTLENIAKLMNA